MNIDLMPHTVYCPYCSEMLNVLIDPQDIGNEYIEDCQVCCRPIVFSITETGFGEIEVNVRDENDSGF